MPHSWAAPLASQGSSRGASVGSQAGTRVAPAQQGTPAFEDKLEPLLLIFIFFALLNYILKVCLKATSGSFLVRALGMGLTQFA